MKKLSLGQDDKIWLKDQLQSLSINSTTQETGEKLHCSWRMKNINF